MKDVIIASLTLLIAIITSLVYFKSFQPKWLRLFPLFLSFSFLIQIVGVWYSSHFAKSNHFIFNAYMLIENEFYFIIFFKAVASVKLKKVVFILALSFLFFYVYHVLFFKHFFVFDSYVNSFGQLLILLCGLLYLSELLMLERIVNYFQVPMFWITTGIIVSVVSNFIYLCFFDFILKNKLDPNGDVYAIILTSTNLIEYALFTIGFVCNKIWKKAT